MNAQFQIEKLAQVLIESGMATAETIVGCSEDEIESVETQFSIRLPESYKAYLRKMGKEMGEFATDVIMTYPGIASFCRPSAERNAARHGFTLLPKHFVFLIREDVFMFFDSSLEDPPAYRLDIVVDKEPLLVGNTFLEYLTRYIYESVELTSING